MTARGAARVAGVGAVLVLVVAGCIPGGGGEDVDTGARFAVTNATVVVSPGDSYPVNFVFLAEPSDPIWDGLQGIGFPKGQQVEAHQLTVERSDAREGGLVLGNIRLEVAPEDREMEFGSIELFLEGGSGPQVVDVGSWRINWSERPSEVAPTGDYAVAMSRCGRVEGALVNESSVALSVSDISVETPGAEVTRSTLPPVPVAPGETIVVAAEVNCDPRAADFYVLTPQIHLTRPDGSTLTAHLDPIAVALTAIDQETLRQIAQRES